MITEEKKLWAVEQIRHKYEEIGRLPKKEDFDEVTRSQIKAFLGPWPRALEAAGLKEAKPTPDKPKKKKIRRVKSKKKKQRKTKQENTGGQENHEENQESN